jgi:Methyltransferase domain
MPFNPLDHPELYAEPLWLPETSYAWIEHIPFAFLLVNLAQPRTLVELGAHGGMSYCAFCQAVHMANLPTTCKAVDTWVGDTQIGFYPDTIYQTLRQYHDPRYGQFSQLLRMTFDDAIRTIEDHSIDILHIDGNHTYEAVSHDFRTWLPKMSPRGIVLFHDSAVLDRGFGVYKLMEELKPRYPHFQYLHGYGLSLFIVGSSPPAAVSDWVHDATADPPRIRRFFECLGRNLKRQFDLTVVSRNLAATRHALANWQRAHNMDVYLADESYLAENPVDSLSVLNQAIQKICTACAALPPAKPAAQFFIGKS